jgi:hypothetical protein
MTLNLKKQLLLTILPMFSTVRSCSIFQNRKLINNIMQDIDNEHINTFFAW